MRKAWGKVALLAALTAMAAGGTAQAKSFYQMNGVGSISLQGEGIPACAPVVQTCDNPNQSFSWGQLQVQGLGVLQDQNVAGVYSCSSEGTGYQSRIYGNTTDFELTFNFVCKNQNVGVGPNYIEGWFSNVVDNNVGTYAAFHNVGNHPLNAAGQIRGGAFAFVGYFRQTSSPINPYNVGAADAPMACGGGFAPTGFGGQGGTNITTAAFAGSCQAVSAS